MADEQEPVEPEGTVEPEEDEEDGEGCVRLDDTLQSFPLLRDDLYLRMQTTNLNIVDAMLEAMERDLLHEYLELERTPTRS